MLLNNELLKKLAASVSNDVLRADLCSVHVKVGISGSLQLTATDGHTGIRLLGVKREELRTCVKTEYGAAIEDGILGKEGDQVFLYLDNKMRKKLAKYIVNTEGSYPNIDGCIPKTFSSPVDRLPFFGYEVNAAAKKALGNMTGYFPDKWNGSQGFTLKYLEDKESFFFAMPMKPPKEWIKEHPGWGAATS